MGWSEIKNSRRLFLSSYYRPDRDPKHHDQFRAPLDTITTVHSKNPNNPIIIGGDLNYPDIQWEDTCQTE